MNRKQTPVSCMDLYEQNYQTCIENCDDDVCQEKCQAELDERILMYGQRASSNSTGPYKFFYSERST